MSVIDNTVTVLPLRRQTGAPVFEIHRVNTPARFVRFRSILVRHSRGGRHDHLSLSRGELLQLCHEKPVHVVHVRVEPEGITAYITHAVRMQVLRGVQQST